MTISTSKQPTQAAILTILKRRYDAGFTRNTAASIAAAAWALHLVGNSFSTAQAAAALKLLEDKGLVGRVTTSTSKRVRWFLTQDGFNAEVK